MDGFLFGCRMKFFFVRALYGWFSDYEAREVVRVVIAG